MAYNKRSLRSAAEGAMRWTPKRKAEIVIALLEGKITPAWAKDEYGISDEELAAWMRDYAAYGPEGLHVTRLQQYSRRPIPVGFERIP
jgi:transposase-like protein